MSLEHIIKDLEHDAKAEADDILADAKKQADGIIAKAKAESASFEREETARAKKDAARLFASSSQAKIEVERTRSAIEMELYEKVAEKVRSRLYSMHRDRKAYERYVEKAVRQGAGFVGQDFVIAANRRDAPLAKGFGRVARAALEREGGVVVSTPDGKIRADSTFEALFSEREQETISAARQLMRK